MKSELKPYWQLRAQLSLHNNLLLYRDRIVVPEKLRRHTMEKFTKAIRASPDVASELNRRFGGLESPKPWIPT